MRLFLASHDFGNYQKELLSLVGLGRKALLITNARDYKTNSDRLADVNRKLGTLKSAGFSVEELDLRRYFGKSDELRKYITNYSPDLIYAIGGNVFLLATAYKLSGFNQILREELENDRYVYAGGSAGAMVTAKTLKYYGHDHLTPEKISDIYGVDATLDGLGLIDKFIVPHADLPDYQEATRLYINRITKAGETPIVLNQSAAYIVHNNKIKKLD